MRNITIFRDFSHLVIAQLLKTRTTKVEHKAPGMCGQEYVWTDQHTDKVKSLET